MPPGPVLPPLLPFDEAARLVVEHLKREVPLAFWSVSRQDDGRQVYVRVRDDAYGVLEGGSRPWDETLCRHMVAGAPQFAPDAMAVPEYASAGVSLRESIGAYVGVPIRAGDGRLYGTICGLDPQIAARSLVDHAPLLRLCASLLGQILHGEQLRSDAADREAQLAWSASHDDLTGLPNRVLFFERVAHALDARDRDGRSVAVLLIDLDEFKAVNDTLGHAAGDDVLTLAAARLGNAVRPTDTLARLSGDEFAVLLEGAADPTVVAGRLVRALADPFVVGGRPVTISGSVGVVELAADDPDAGVEEVLARADIAMYAAKHGGKGRYALHEPRMTLPQTRTLELRDPLRRAIAAGVVQAHYQPVVELATGHTIGVEALARWHHDGRDVGPDVFIPIAARSGLAAPLTAHMLDVACAQAARWSTVPGGEGLQVSVNVSPHALGDPGLPDQVDRVLTAHGLGPGRLALEITEDALLRNPATAAGVAHQLRELGVVLSLDDFGVGYSSLLHLRQIPLHSVKIDRGFAGDIDTNPDTEHFMRAVLSLGRDLGLRVVVEGVERTEQVDVLRRIGATHAQGFLFGRPVPAAEVPLTAGCPAAGMR
jgi:diguanylate cyclase